MAQGCWWRLFGRCIVPLNWRMKTNRQYTIVAQANRSAREHIITANCTPMFYWKWTTWIIWRWKSMTICVASNESISLPARWHIFARGQRKGREWRLPSPTEKWTNNGNYQSIKWLQRHEKQMPTLLPFAHLAILQYFSTSAKWVFNFSGRHRTHLGKISLTLWEKTKYPICQRNNHKF